MLVACVLLKHFPFQLERERLPRLVGHEVVIVETRRNNRTVLDTSPAISGLSPGTPLQEGQARYPEAIQLEADIPLYQRRFEEILAALEQVSPVVQESELGCAYVGLDGLSGMYGGTDGLMKVLKAAVPPNLEPRFGIGPGKFPATTAAVTAEPGQVVFAPTDLKGFLASYPVDVLPISWETCARLKRLGLKTLGDIARQAIGPMQAHFGPEGKLIWEMAQGVDTRPIIPRKRELQFSARVDFPVPIVALEPILLATESILARLFALPGLRGRYSRAALLQAAMTRRPSWQRRVAFKEAVGDPQKALVAIKYALELHSPPGPLEDLTLTLMGITGEAGRQGNLVVDLRKQDQLREVLQQLEVRLGKRPPFYQFRSAEPWSRIPERRNVMVEYFP